MSSFCFRCRSYRDRLRLLPAALEAHGHEHNPGDHDHADAPAFRQIPLDEFKGLLRHPGGVAVDNDGSVYVADHDGNRVLELAANSHTPTQMSQFNGVSWPSGVAVDAHRNVYVTDAGNNRVSVGLVVVVGDGVGERFSVVNLSDFGQGGGHVRQGLVALVAVWLGLGGSVRAVDVAQVDPGAVPVSVPEVVRSCITGIETVRRNCQPTCVPPLGLQVLRKRYGLVSAEVSLRVQESVFKVL